MAIFDITYLNEYSSNNEYNSSKKSNHLNKDTLQKILNILITNINKFPKLKKCCDFTDLFYKDHINDDGERESPIEEYYNSSSTSYIQLISGDIFSGYPNFKDNGKNEYDKDEQDFIKLINNIFKEKGIKAKFIKGYNENDEEIDFGVKSL